MRAPAVVYTEIAWRWTFGVALWAILYYSFREYFASVDISNAEYSLLRSLEPFTWIAIAARVMVALITGLRMMGPIIIPAIVILWIALATIGRAATIRALSDSVARCNWTSTLALHLFSVALTLASVAAYFGCGILINNLVGDPAQHFAASFLLSFLALLVITLVWSVANWFFSLSTIFTVRDGAGFISSLGDTADLYHRESNAFFSTGLWFGLMRTVLVVAATVLSLTPVARLSAAHARMTFLIVATVTLAYFALADALNMWRLAAYVSLTEPEPTPPVLSIPPPPPPVELLPESVSEGNTFDSSTPAGEAMPDNHQ